MWAITSSSAMWPIGENSATRDQQQPGGEAELAPDRHRPAAGRRGSIARFA